MAVPARRTSKTKKRTRRASVWKATAPTLVKCPNCSEYTVPHRVCPSCGQYNGREVINVD